MPQNHHHSLERTSGSPDIPSDQASYLLFLKGDQHTPQANGNQIIIAESVSEANDFLKLLGNYCMPWLSQEYQRNHPGILEHLTGLCSPVQSKEAPFDIDTAAVLMKNLPLDLKSLVKSQIALRSEDRMPSFIPKEMVHKTHKANVLISEPFSTGWLYYFNLFSETDELTFDHPSDHIQGMIILEALRQTGIAMGHLQGLPSDGIIALLSYNTNFYNFVERDNPVILRAFSSFTANSTSQDKKIDVFIQLIQSGRLCADTKLKGYAYMNAEISMKKEAQLEKIYLRNKKHFDAKVNRITKMELSH